MRTSCAVLVISPPKASWSSPMMPPVTMKALVSPSGAFLKWSRIWTKLFVSSRVSII